MLCIISCSSVIVFAIEGKFATNAIILVTILARALSCARPHTHTHAHNVTHALARTPVRFKLDALARARSILSSTSSPDLWKDRICHSKILVSCGFIIFESYSDSCRGGMGKVGLERMTSWRKAPGRTESLFSGDLCILDVLIAVVFKPHDTAIH